MIRSRLRNYQDRKERRQIVLILTGMVALFLFLAIFGVRILVGFSLLVDRLRGTPATKEEKQTLLLPPQLDPVSEATNTAQIIITGKSKDAASILLYVNEEQTEKVTPKEDGTFTFSKVSLKEGENTISAKITDDEDTLSDLSNVLTIFVKKNKPMLEISQPSENAELSGEKQQTTLTGKTDPDNTLMVNDRLVVVASDGSFSYNLPLAEGHQTITIIAKDQAGNETKLERQVTYKK